MYKLFGIFVILFFSIFHTLGQIVLPNLLTNHAVLQRDIPVKIWGTASSGEKITVKFGSFVAKTNANKTGNWAVMLPSTKAGGPYTIEISGKNKIVLNDILFGDVYVCSGQSNMEWSVLKSNHAKQEIDSANFPQIRILNVDKKTSTFTVDNVQTKGWSLAIGNNIKHFSAVGFFFGKHLYQTQNIPIGLIGSNWGGTKIETWMSTNSLSKFDYLKDLLKEQNQHSNNRMAFENWRNMHYPKSDEGTVNHWESVSYNDSNWSEMNIPQKLENTKGLENFDGVIWFRKSFVLPADMKNENLWLHLGFIGDFNELYINGKKIDSTNFRSVWRTHSIPKDLLKINGENVIAVRVFNPKDSGGMFEKIPQNMVFSKDQWSPILPILPMYGTWKYKVGLKLEKPITDSIPIVITNPNGFYSSLYNGMIYPLLNYKIKGAIWYQGESNNTDAVNYKKLLPTMISDWRSNWGYDFPFLIVQLANFNDKKPRCTFPCKSTYAELREAQFMATNLSFTGIATAIDIGLADDIHPTNKQDVGKRLGLVAQKMIYNQNVVSQGPVYESMIIEGNKIRLKFKNIENGWLLKGRYGYINGFAIAGADKNLVWAKAEFDGKDILVFSDNIKNPIAVRYAWENNPEDANLYNADGLPAFPFRTDDWDK